MFAYFLCLFMLVYVCLCLIVSALIGTSNHGSCVANSIRSPWASTRSITEEGIISVWFTNEIPFGEH